jgi:hypothetical protein
VDWSDHPTIWTWRAWFVYRELVLCLNSLGFFLNRAHSSSIYLGIFGRYGLAVLRYKIGLGMLHFTYLVRMLCLDFRYGIRIIKNVLCVKERDNNGKSRSNQKIGIAAEYANACDCDQDKQAGNNGDDLGGLHSSTNASLHG